MPIQTRCEGNTIVVSVSGRLDAVTTPAYRAAVAALIESGSTRVVTDLQDLAYIASTGLHELLAAARALAEKGGAFCVANVHGSVANVFEICGIGRMLKIYPSLAEALAAIGASSAPSSSGASG